MENINNSIIKSTIQLRPRYGEVDKMGYVYHSHYLEYCHQARTELLRAAGISDSLLESKGIIMPVISFSIKYKNPAHYDELIHIKTIIRKLPQVRFTFEFEIYKENGEPVCEAESTVVFVNKDSRCPLKAPGFVINALSTK